MRGEQNSAVAGVAPLAAGCRATGSPALRPLPVAPHKPRAPGGALFRCRHRRHGQPRLLQILPSSASGAGSCIPAGLTQATDLRRGAQSAVHLTVEYPGNNKSHAALDRCRRLAETRRRARTDSDGLGPRHRPGAHALPVAMAGRLRLMSYHTIPARGSATLQRGAGIRPPGLGERTPLAAHGRRTAAGIECRAGRSRPSGCCNGWTGSYRRLPGVDARHGPVLLPARKTQLDVGFLRRRPQYSVLGRGRQPVRRQHQLDQLHRDPGQGLRDQLAIPDQQPGRGARADVRRGVDRAAVAAAGPDVGVLVPGDPLPPRDPHAGQRAVHRSCRSAAA